MPPPQEGSPRRCQRRAPPSAGDASFVLACAARRARGRSTRTTRCSSTSPASPPCRRQVRPGQERARRHSRISCESGRRRRTPSSDELRDLWETDFVPTTGHLRSTDAVTADVVDEVERISTAASHGIKVTQINGTAGDVLDYEDHPATGSERHRRRRRQASRGLTLEGLSSATSSAPRGCTTPSCRWGAGSATGPATSISAGCTDRGTR